jgi:hypothetical protein
MTTPIWSRAFPRTPGHYFVRSPFLRPRVVEFYMNGGRLVGGPSYILKGAVEYGGPIQLPEEPDFLVMPDTLTEERE